MISGLSFVVKLGPWYTKKADNIFLANTTWECFFVNIQCCVKECTQSFSPVCLVRTSLTINSAYKLVVYFKPCPPTTCWTFLIKPVMRQYTEILNSVAWPHCVVSCLMVAAILSECVFPRWVSSLELSVMVAFEILVLFT